MFRIELQILDWIQNLRTPWGDVFWPMITSLGNAGIIWILLTAVLLFYPRTRRCGVILLAALLVDLLFCNVIIKNAVARTRPFDINTSMKLLIDKPDDFSFPSGHTAASFASAAALYFAGNKKLFIFALILAVLIAFSRLYLYVHFPTDILGGMLVGSFSGYVGYRIVDWAEKKKKIK